jgi:hypothetical protein
MKAVKIGAGMVALFVVAVAAFSSARADVAYTVDRVDEFRCTIGYNTAMGMPTTGTVITTDSRSHITPSGNVVLKCKGQLPEGAEPDRAVVWRDTPCATNWGMADKHQKTFTPSGVATLTCEVKANN